jgi:hypothetical protein
LEVKKTVDLTIRFPKNLHRQIKLIAMIENRSFSAQVLRMLSDYIEATIESEVVAENPIQKEE